MPAEAMIELRRVVKTYRTGAGPVTVLKGVDLQLRRGEFAAIVGKSGSGKSTLLNMITGIDHPTSGQVIVGGTDLYTLTESQRALWRGRNLGVVFQFFQLLPMLSLLENVMLPMDYTNTYAFDERPGRALDLLRRVGLAEQAYKHPDAVSTGQQQCAAIARAMATDPALIVADEPTGNLDSRSADVIMDLFAELVRAGKTIAMVTHDPSLTGRMDRLLVISDGELVDEAVARSLPGLTHRQMLAATRLVQRQTCPAGAPILAAGRPVDRVLLVAGGQVERIAAAPPAAGRPWVLGPGSVLAAAEALAGAPAQADYRAGPQTVELACFSRQDFADLMAAAPGVRAALAAQAAAAAD